MRMMIENADFANIGRGMSVRNKVALAILQGMLQTRIVLGDADFQLAFKWADKFLAESTREVLDGK